MVKGNSGAEGSLVRVRLMLKLKRSEKINLEWLYCESRLRFLISKEVATREEQDRALPNCS